MSVPLVYEQAGRSEGSRVFNLFYFPAPSSGNFSSNHWEIECQPDHPASNHWKKSDEKFQALETSDCHDFMRYPAYFEKFLSTVPDNGIIMGHPGLNGP